MAPSPAPPHLLLIDDDEELRETIAALLTDEGFTCVQAADGAQARALLRAGEAPDLILLDLRMPVMDGWEFLGWQRGDAETAGVPVLVMTGVNDGSEASGPSAPMIAKPLDFGRLLGLIHELIDGADAAAGASGGLCALADDAADDDERLVAQMAGGDNDALARLIGRHGPALHGLLRRMVGPAEAEEVLQEVFVQAWVEAGRFRSSRASPRAWLFMIARSRALDRLRAGQARRRREVESARDLWPAAVVEPVSLSGLERGERVRSLAAALRALPDGQRRCVVLAYCGGLTHREVASRLGAPLGTVKSRIRMGLERLRETLDREVAAHAAGAEEAMAS